MAMGGFRFWLGLCIKRIMLFVLPRFGEWLSPFEVVNNESNKNK